jgi:phospholipase/carboxylesterase/glyoxalase family protein
MELGFIHRFVPASDPNSKLIVLALHGTGGDESDLIPLAEMLVPGAAILSPRGKVLENGMPRFFRRLREGVFDFEDVKFRARELVEFIASAAAAYQFDAANLMAVGYSNGANIAAAILLLHPGAISRAVLLRSMVPIEPEHPPNLEGAAVFMAAGRRDPIIPPAETQRLAAMLREYGAQISLEWNDADHRLATSDIQAARKWLGAVTIRGNDEHSV